MVDIIGYLAGILGMVSFLPQLFKTLKTKNVEGISIKMLWLFIITNILYIAYSLALTLIPMLITLTIMTVIIIWQLLLTLKYRKKA
jgi:MtN3 and saliva related transmembrane protein